MYEPYIPANTRLKEFSIFPLIVGILLGMLFGASSLYLVLKVGMTVSASIPVAVISITFFKLLQTLRLRRSATILENNLVQTAGSAGESIAFGVGVTMPAILILGFDLELTRVALVACLGGLLGILMMIPLRRPLIVQQHGVLKYPEGTACAEVLKAGANEESREAAAEWARAEHAMRGGSTSAITIVVGFLVGLVYKIGNSALHFWKDTPGKVFGYPLKGGSVAAEISPELLGVGYIIGPKTASIMCGGGVLAYLVLIPLIKYFGEGLPQPLAPALGKTIGEMTPGDIRSEYILYIGAGAVAAGGIISLFRSLPTIWHGLKEGLRDLRGAGGETAGRPRTDQDLPMKFVAIGVAVLVVLLAAMPALRLGPIGALLVVLFGFLFVTVSSRLVGEIGSSSNPISGMTVATLLLTCGFFVMLGWDGSGYYVTALSVGAVVCIAASNAGATSQDLKTGFLVGATPRLQQVAILLGAFASALILGPLLLALNQAYTVYVPVTERVVGQRTEVRERILGPQADGKEYLVWHTEGEDKFARKYLLDPDTLQAVWLVDPGINGKHSQRPDGSTVTKFDAPKATLMSYIIKGILNRELPWGLVILGVMISLVLELAGIPSLAFAVGVYLPISSSTPIFAGGMVRWLVDRYLAREKGLTGDELAAEGDKSPGVLMASGYIAGGAIGGIFLALMLAQFSAFNTAMEKLAEGNPFASGPYADALALLPFLALIALLYLTGRELLFRGRKTQA